jgi:hypothetical protein
VIVPRGTYDFYTVIDHESDIRPNFEVVVIHKEMPNAEGEVRGIADHLNGCAPAPLSHDDICMLSRIFNASTRLHIDQYRRINEWLKNRILEAFLAEEAARPSAFTEPKP